MKNKTSAVMAKRACALVAALCFAALVLGAQYGQADVANDADSGEKPAVAAPSEDAQNRGTEAEEFDFVALLTGAKGTSAEQVMKDVEAGVESDYKAQDVPFTMDTDCYQCHEKAIEKMVEEGYTGVAHANLACGVCHAEEDMVQIHTTTEKYTAKKGKRVAALSKSSIIEEACFACHGSIEELAEATANSEALTDENGTTVNPHELPADHFGSKVVCGSCHKFHNTEDTQTSSANSCLTCHHNNIYECNTCHVV